MPSAIILSDALRESIETEVQEIRRALQDSFRLAPNGTDYGEEESTTAASSSSSGSNEDTTLTDQRLFSVLSTHLLEERTGPTPEEGVPSDEERCTLNETNNDERVTKVGESFDESGSSATRNGVVDTVENAVEDVEYYTNDSSDVTEETYDDTEENDSSYTDGCTSTDEDEFQRDDEKLSKQLYDEEDSNSDEAAFYHKGATELFRSLEEQNWIEATRILHHSPHEAKIWVVRTKSEATNKWDCHWKRLPLHEAVRQHAPFNLIDLLVQAYSGACRECTQFGELPLHLALDNGLSPKIVHLLLLHHIMAFKATDQSGRLPLELLHDARQLNATEHRSLVCVFTAVERSWNEIQGKHQRDMKKLEESHAKSYVNETYSNASKVQAEKAKQTELKREIEALKKDLEQQKSDHEKQIQTLEAEKVELKKSLKASQIATARVTRDMESEKSAHQHEIGKLRLVLKRATQWRSPQVDVVKNKLDESVLKFVTLQDTLSDHRDDLGALLENIGVEPKVPNVESVIDSEEEWTD